MLFELHPSVALLFIPLPLFATLMPAIGGLSRRAKFPSLIPAWTFVGLAAALVGVTDLLMRGVPQEVYLGTLSIDAFSVYFAGVVLLVTLLIGVASIDYMSKNPNIETYYALMLLAALGMMLIAFAIDVVVLYLAWELMSIPTYILVGIEKPDPTSNEAAIKYFLVSALSSAMIVYAISLAFGITGTTSITGIARGLASALPSLEPLAVFSAILFTVGFGMKVAAVPFHMWVPDAYEGAPATIGAFLAAGSKTGGFAALLRVFPVALIGLRFDWSTTFAIIALLTMTLGNIAALMQRSFTRLLAYSSIAHAGYVLIGLASANPTGYVGALYHVFTHATMKTAAFVAAAAVLWKLRSIDLESFKGLGSRMPATAITLTFSLLALAGVPPLNGFMSKLVLFTAAIDANLAWLALAGVLNSAFSLAYYGWIIKRMYFDEAADASHLQEPSSFTAVLAASTAIIILTGIYPQPLLDFANKVVRLLYV